MSNEFNYIVSSKLTKIYTDLDAYFWRSYNCNSNALADRAKLVHNKAGFTMLVDGCDNVVSDILHYLTVGSHMLLKQFQSLLSMETML